MLVSREARAVARRAGRFFLSEIFSCGHAVRHCLFDATLNQNLKHCLFCFPAAQAEDTLIRQCCACCFESLAMLLATSM